MLQAIKRFFTSGDTPAAPELVVLSRDEHPISRSLLSPNALKVLYRLHNHNYEAYLVGGGVRDVMVGLKPKDFDVVTNATPEEVRQLFRNSRIIGRRFRIVHVLFGREVIEVATYRAPADSTPDTQDSLARSDSGRLLRDNVWGTLEDDIKRRDFTINAMYYTPADFSLVTLPESMQDLKDRRLRMIGDPATRYREDPVRMLRAVRFAAKLDFDLARATAEPIPGLAHHLEDVPPARLFDDVLKLFMSGNGARTWHLLQHYGLFAPLFPDTQEALDRDDQGYYARLIEAALDSTDQRIADERPVTPAFLLAAFLWPVVEQLARANQEAGIPPVPALQQAAQEASRMQSQHTSVPKRFQMTMRDIWDLQLRLPNRHGQRAERLLEHPKFRAAYDFLLLREQAGEDLDGLGQWWTDFQERQPANRERMMQDLNAGSRRKRGRRRSRQS